MAFRQRPPPIALPICCDRKERHSQGRQRPPQRHLPVSQAAMPDATRAAHKGATAGGATAGDATAMAPAAGKLHPAVTPMRVAAGMDVTLAPAAASGRTTSVVAEIAAIPDVADTSASSGAGTGFMTWWMIRLRIPVSQRAKAGSPGRRLERISTAIFAGSLNSPIAETRQTSLFRLAPTAELRMPMETSSAPPRCSTC